MQKSRPPFSWNGQTASTLTLAVEAAQFSILGRPNRT